MKKSSLLARVLLCASTAAPGVALAQAMAAPEVTTTAVATVTDPAAAVPPVVYQSVFADTPTGVEMESADWKKANAEVGQFKRGHVDILKWEEAPAKAPMPPKPMTADAATKPAMPSAPPSPPRPSPSPSPLSTPTPQAPSVHKH